MRRTLTLAVLGALASAADARRPRRASPRSRPQPNRAVGTAAPTTSSSVAAKPSPSTSTSASASVAASAAPPAAKGPPSDANVILLTIDSLRADMPWAGYPRRHRAAPHRLREEGGELHPRLLHLLVHGDEPRRPARGPLPRRARAQRLLLLAATRTACSSSPTLLQKAGVRTLAAHAHFYFDKQHAGFHQGFDVYEIVPGITADNKTDENITSPAARGRSPRRSSATRRTRAAASSPGSTSSTRTTSTCRTPASAPTARRARDKYDAEVTFTDQHVGKLLDFVAAAALGAKDGHHRLQRPRRGVRRAQAWAPRLRALTRCSCACRSDDPRARRRAPPRRRAAERHRSRADHPRARRRAAGALLRGQEPGAGALRQAAPRTRDVIVDLPRTSDNDRRRALIHGSARSSSASTTTASAGSTTSRRTPAKTTASRPATSTRSFTTPTSRT